MCSPEITETGDATLLSLVALGVLKQAPTVLRQTCRVPDCTRTYYQQEQHYGRTEGQTPVTGFDEYRLYRIYNPDCALECSAIDNAGRGSSMVNQRYSGSPRLLATSPADLFAERNRGQATGKNDARDDRCVAQAIPRC